MGHNTCKSMGRVLCVVRRYHKVFSHSVMWSQTCIGIIPYRTLAVD